MDYNVLSHDGYVVDVPYVSGFYKELTPNYLRTLTLLQQCSLPHREENEPFRYLELGFGQGGSLCIHAASNEGEFWGTDFNATHALTAQKNLVKSNTKGEILCDSFAELSQKSENGLLPNFDIITLHGIWSWINDENRKHILNIISHSLKIGGLVYVSYNTLPGFADFAPVRDFLAYHAKAHNSSSKTSVEKFQEGYGLLKALKNGGAQFFNVNPAVNRKFDNLEMQNLSYLVHEYLNQDWESFYFKDVSADMLKAKCSFMGSARPLTALPSFLSAEVRQVLESVSDSELRETLRDFTHNTQFRCDIFAKGKDFIAPQAYIQELDKLSFVLLCTKEKVNYKVATPIGEVQCKEDIYKPLIDFLAKDDYSPKTFQEIRQLPPYKELPIIMEVLLVLLGSGAIHPAQSTTQKLIEQSVAINKHFFNENLRNIQMLFYASPVLGGGVYVPFIEQTFIEVYSMGHTTNETLVANVAKLFMDSGIKTSENGKELVGNEVNAYLAKFVDDFQERVPLLKALKIINV